MLAGPAFRFGWDAGKAPEERLVALLGDVRSWLEAARIEQLLDALTGDPSLRALFDETDRIDHIGFLLPNWAKPIVSTAATDAGFPLGHRAFPSALLARELGRITGRRRLETQIFKAHGRSARGDIAFEAFIPRTDDAQVETWIRGGVCNHVAIAMSAPERFAQVASRLVGAGIRMSSFMYGNAVYLPDEDATITYFDLDDSEHPFRLEVRAHGEHAVQP